MIPNPLIGRDIWYYNYINIYPILSSFFSFPNLLEAGYTPVDDTLWLVIPLVKVFFSRIDKKIPSTVTRSDVGRLMLEAG